MSHVRSQKARSQKAQSQKTPRSRVWLTLVLGFSLLGQSLVVFAAPCGAADHKHEMDHQVMQVEHHSGHGAHHAPDAPISSDHEKMDCCGADPSACAMNVSVLVVLSNEILFQTNTTLSHIIHDQIISTVSRTESFYRPPISA
jgi:hypothetical protein